MASAMKQRLGSLVARAGLVHASRGSALWHRGLAVPAGEDGDIVKSIFVTSQKKFRAILGELGRVKINVDPNDDKAVKEYHSTMRQIRQKLSIPSYTEKLGDLLDSAAEDAPDVRTFYLLQRSLRIEMSVPEIPGYESAVFQAIDKVEKKIGKPLVRDDVKGISLFKEELDAVNAKFSLNPDALDELEAQLELSISKGELAQMKKEAESQMETYKRRDDLEHINVDVKTLDPRPYL